MPKITIRDSVKNRTIESDISVNSRKRIIDYLSSTYGYGFDVYIDGFKYGQMDKNEYEEFIKIFNIHFHRVDENNYEYEEEYTNNSSSDDYF